MMKLKENIINQKPREKAGSTSSSRFDYQKDWSLCQLLEYHNSESDYLFIFDYHEDLLILNSETNPDKISFYQIKGNKSTNWTTDRLIKSEKDKNGNPLLSILGKLYECKNKFELETKSLNFVSNTRFNIKLNNGLTGISKNEICIIEIADKDKKKIKDKLVNELSINNNPIFEDITFLKVLN